LKSTALPKINCANWTGPSRNGCSIGFSIASKDVKIPGTLGNRCGEIWRYRVGDFRIICEIQDEKLVVLALAVGHRREIYQRGK